MKLSDLVTTAEDFIATHGDAEMESEYWCVDCKDFHTSEGVTIELGASGKAHIEARRLGDE